MSERSKQPAVPFQTLTRATTARRAGLSPASSSSGGSVAVSQPSPTRPSRISARLSPAPMANNDDLIQALTAFTQAAANDRVLQQQKHDDLLQAPRTQQDENAVLRNLVTAGPMVNRPSTAVVDSIPKFEGHWNRLIQDRVQQPNESGIEYALDKFRLCRLSPTPLAEQDAIPFLINGLAKWEHVAAMTAAAPVNIPAFIARIQQLEQLGVSARSDVAPLAPNRQMNIPPPQPPDLAAAFNNFSEKLVAELATKLESLTVSRSVGRGRGGPPGAARPPMECWLCQNTGHKARYCPTRPENTSAGR
ncbi:hypothetical protein DAPPUDRAFT_113138 [Daphnia pulex]|uniref:CCHC-type domain-containing protein n=1 Tax=Daphnia pulex TaxID=6669 RepID=E9HE70_DAPPU|nr:hypothetical protein DAPPUDRAFT_113138 [Daphnia pulex]|eukprot:EFX69962.1 hypothetical protein DAPPUDRAFT_113138 [Daphnia pulex]